jgi:hypothetical protein
MRSLPGGILGQLTMNGAYPGYLIIIAGLGFYTTFDTDVTWSGETYAAIDIDVPSLLWDGSSVRPARLVLGDFDGEWWGAALSGAFSDTRVNIYQAYAGAVADAVFLWTGHVGDVSRVNALSGSPSVTLELTDGSSTDSTPRHRVQEVIADQYLIRAGTVLMIGGQQITINRPTSAAG